MLNHDAADDPRASYFDDPVDHMEPAMEIEETPEQAQRRIEREAYREAASNQIAFMFAVFGYIHEARSKEEMVIRFWAATSAITHPATGGRPDCELASMVGTTKANFSKHVLAIERQNGLPPTDSQKSVQARKSYSENRKEQIHARTE